jgi:hypothetical protein
LVGHREDRHVLPVYQKTVFPQLWLTVLTLQSPPFLAKPAIVVLP